MNKSFRDGVDREPAFYGQGSGSIYRMAHCSGKEYSLWECPHVECGFGCSHRFDAGVECNGTGKHDNRYFNALDITKATSKQ